MSRRFTVSVDAMGGDFAPAEVVKGSVDAAREMDIVLKLAGAKDAVEAELAKLDTTGLDIAVIDAPDVIKDGEEPAMAVMRRPGSSVVVATNLVKDGAADAVISAGSTGAFMVAAMQFLGRLPGVERPMIGGPFLGLAPGTVILDLGANVGVQPYHLLNFAVAGAVYAESFLGIENPTVGILSVGAEEGKGNELTKEAAPLLKKSGLNFIGNVEGMDIPFGRANVVVCDGFVGNILVKFCEGLGRSVSQWVGGELAADLSPERLEKVSSRLYRLLSPGVVLGGGPMWGVDGVACVAHGASRAAQITGTFRQALEAHQSGFVGKLRDALEKAQTLISE